MRRDSDRRRYVVASACSVLIHALALVLAAFFVVHAVLSGLTAPEAALAPDATIVVTPPSAPPSTRPTALPTVAPKRRPKPPLVSRPRPRPRSLVVPQHAVPAPQRVPPLHHELARNVRNATPQPSAAPIPTEAPATPMPRRVAVLPSPAPVATAPPTRVPTLPPTPQPTLAPTEAPTAEPSLRPTPEPTVHPTLEPTAAPTAAPTPRPTPEPTARPAPAPTAEPTARATAAAAVRSTSAARPAAPAAASAASAPARTGSPERPPRAAASGPPPPEQGATVAPPAPASPSSGAPVSSSLAALNARMKALLPTGSAGGMASVDMGTYHTDRVLDAYEASLAPPLEILLKTFGLIYTKRTAGQADSIAYVYERTRILGVEVCRAYTIVEHPLREVAPNADHLGPAGQAMSGRPAALAFPGPLADVKPQISTETVPCNAKGMIPVVPGSLHSPVPRRLEPGAPPAP